MSELGLTCFALSGGFAGWQIANLILSKPVDPAMLVGSGMLLVAAVAIQVLRR